ncbi:MAG: RNA polymerase sigma factor, partial [Planctomycetes bacterium]|nr:RNA polymerase sigma factor [Planctomycetota bacterium]
NWTWLKGLLYSILGNADQVDDALQNVCVRVIEKVHTLKNPESFRPWLATVARHSALSQRTKNSKNPVSLNELLAAQQMTDKDCDTAEKIVKQEQHKLILDAIKQIPEKYREVFVLKYIKDMTYAEIGDTLDLPITTIQIRLVRARRMIYNRMTGKPTDKVPRT